MPATRTNAQEQRTKGTVADDSLAAQARSKIAAVHKEHVSQLTSRVSTSRRTALPDVPCFSQTLRCGTLSGTSRRTSPPKNAKQNIGTAKHTGTAKYKTKTSLGYSSPASVKDGSLAKATGFRSSPPAELDVTDFDADMNCLIERKEVKPSPTSNELTESMLNKTQDLIRRLSDLGLETPKQKQTTPEIPNGSGDDELLDDVRSESGASDKSEWWDPEKEEDKRNTIEVPLELWKMMERMRDEFVAAAHDGAAGEGFNLETIQKLGDQAQLCKLLSKTSLASSDSTDAASTAVESDSTASEDDVNGTPLHGTQQTCKDSLPTSAASSQPSSPKPFSPRPVVRNSHMRFPSPTSRRLRHVESVTLLSPRSSWTTLPKSVNVTASIQSSHGHAISVTTNVLTSTQINVWL